MKKSDTAIHLWYHGLIHINEILSRGRRVVFSSCWYIDRAEGHSDWLNYYRCMMDGKCNFLREMHILYQKLYVYKVPTRKNLENLEKWESTFQSGNFEQTGKVRKGDGKSNKILESLEMSDRCYLLFFSVI